ncbi:MAG: HAMP domain-containing histidine kinase [Bacteroidales bacterium]|nr:HAMP domain-containing histidine kinase [Bacteroidales bacterium]
MDNKDLVTFLNGVASMVSVLNVNRQIVFVNKLILNMVGASDIQEVLGKRLGELFGCQHAFEFNGCGTSPHCSACGAVRTMLACTRSTESIDECSLTNDDEKLTLDLRVHSTFTKVYGEEFIICSLFDISNEKRRGVMERIFFHDIMNTINGISGIAQVLPKIAPDKQSIYLSHLTRLMNSLTEEIQSHRVLTLAEKNEYRVAQHQVFSLDFIRDEMEKYQQMAALEAKEVRITDDSENHSFITDKTLLSRVLGNMIKNAIEAEHAGALIEVCVRKIDDHLQISVHNDGVIPKRDQLQVFNRSFSTKGENRGLGTYSMKLLTEKYLNGKIGFVSRKDHGTTFTVQLPI